MTRRTRLRILVLIAGLTVFLALALFGYHTVKGVFQDPAPVPTALVSITESVIPVIEDHFVRVLPTRPTPTSQPRPRPVAVPVAHPSTRPTQTPQRASVTRPPALSGASVRGGASWYCEPGVSACPYGYSGGMYAAAGPGTRTLLGPNWRGKIVVTCSTNSPTRCISVKLVDWCACPNGRVIDLFATAFIRLAPLSQGTLMVRVSLLP